MMNSPESASPLPVTTSFQQTQTWAAKYNAPVISHLSLSQYAPLREKDVVSTHHTKRGRLDADAHIALLTKQGALIDGGQALMLLSVRNVMANLRCFGFVRGKTCSPQGVSNDLLSSERSFFALGGNVDGTFFVELFDGRESVPKEWSWFVTGIPVFFDNISDSVLFRYILAEAADHAHVWRLPRGNHPDATDETRGHWSDLHEIFKSHLVCNVKEATDPLLRYSEAKRLKREDRVLHHVLGVDENGRLIQLISSGRLEDLGSQISDLGAIRAICVDNSGSTVVRYRADGGAPWVQLFAAPNHRPAGTAYLLLELNNDPFGHF